VIEGPNVNLTLTNRVSRKNFYGASTGQSQIDAVSRGRLNVSTHTFFMCAQGVQHSGSKREAFAMTTSPTRDAMRKAMEPPVRSGIRITIGDLHLMPTSAMDLRKGDVIAFGDDVCTVLGADYAMGDGDRRADDYVSLVTESPDGSQFVDYVSPVRIFTVIRISDAVA
jgi:hypothetical protein